MSIRIDRLAKVLHRQSAAETSLKESEASYRDLLDNANDLIHSVDPQGRFLYTNRAWQEKLGYTSDEVAHLTLWDIIHPAHRLAYEEIFCRVLSGENVTDVETVLRARDGQTILVEGNVNCRFVGGKPAATRGIFHDVTRRKQAEEERHKLEARLQQLQKLDSLAVLAGGVAHDFNNLLTVMLGHTDLALLRLPQESPVRLSVEQIQAAVLRAAELAKQMLAYSGRSKFVFAQVNLSDLIQEMTQLLRVTVEGHGTVCLELAANLATMEGDATQIRQVILNLVTNAAEAIEPEKGIITLRTGLRHADRGYLTEALFGADAAEGSYLFVEVSDNGCGMDAKTLASIFDPFFTTKFIGRGLGLPAVLGIVRGHKGGITVQSEVGRGSTFTLLFPQSRE